MDFLIRTGTLSVDYNSLVAELWASLKHAHMRIDALEATQHPAVPTDAVLFVDSTNPG